MTLQIPSPPPRIPSLHFKLGRLSALKPWLGGLCLLASVGAHGVLLKMPVSSPAPDEAPVVAEEPLEIMDVAVLPPSPPAAIAPENVALPAVPSPPPVPSQARVAPAAPASPPAPVSQEVSLPAPQDETVIPPESEVSPENFTPPESEPAASAEDPVDPGPYADFPHFQGAEQTTCRGLESCWRSPVEAGSWRGAAQSLQASLEAQGYSLENVTGEVLSVETGVRVYAVSKAGEPPYYLNLVSVQEGFLYSMTSAPITLDTVMALQES